MTSLIINTCRCVPSSLKLKLIYYILYTFLSYLQSNELFFQCLLSYNTYTLHLSVKWEWGMRRWAYLEVTLDPTCKKQCSFRESRMRSYFDFRGNPPFFSWKLMLFMPTRGWLTWNTSLWINYIGRQDYAGTLISSSLFPGGSSYFY